MSKRIITQVNNTLANVPKLTRVAAYARVSSGKDAMLQSLSAQISYYSALIQKHSGWEYAGVYADEAVTGTKDNRPQFVKMIQDCRNGKIDMVVTKSISRFARNTVTLLTTVRELKAYGIDVYFEEQNIHSISGDGELMLTILASYAQEESLSVSENCKWRIRKGFEDGKLTCCAMLGYRSRKGMLEVVPEEAEIVKLIFSLFLEGYGKQAIVNKLNEAGLLSRFGNQWHMDTVGKILRNEKYCGDLLLQKTFRTDHLTKHTKKNNGEMPMYYVQEAHEPIIDRATFEATQAELDRRAKAFCVLKGSFTVFTTKIRCGICGKNYRRKTTPYNVVWCCATYNTKGKSHCASKQIPENILFAVTDKCATPHIMEVALKDGFITAWNCLLELRSEVIGNCRIAIATLCDCAAIDAELAEKNSEVEVLTELTRKHIEENASLARDQEAYQERYNDLLARYTAATERVTELTEIKEKRKSQKTALTAFAEAMERKSQVIEEFDEELWLATVEKATVFSDSRIVFTFINSTEIEA